MDSLGKYKRKQTLPQREKITLYPNIDFENIKYLHGLAYANLSVSARVDKKQKIDPIK